MSAVRWEINLLPDPTEGYAFTSESYTAGIWFYTVFYNDYYTDEVSGPVYMGPNRQEFKNWICI